MGRAKKRAPAGPKGHGLLYRTAEELQVYCENAMLEAENELVGVDRSKERRNWIGQIVKLREEVWKQERIELMIQAERATDEPGDGLAGTDALAAIAAEVVN